MANKGKSGLNTVSLLSGESQGSTTIVDKPSMSSSQSSNPSGNSRVVAFMKDLDKMQNQQLYYAKKIEEEKKRSQKLDALIETARSEEMLLIERTRNGDVLKHEDKVQQKSISRYAILIN